MHAYMSHVQVTTQGIVVASGNGCGSGVAINCGKRDFRIIIIARLKLVNIT